ncbi:MAG TPA: acyl-CoA ligase (AMP-forming), exosortase A system-associated [Aquabacterium sp.]|nr:acyl-CoA ligase (AMP-forming), exosortase A system-associated [Aquabacterium sp.]HEX5354570.1 acyl-CoA ligase (AMP-forming), exosortase A system-associated [Aquabacterium sp.]
MFAPFMTETHLLHDLLTSAAARHASSLALTYGEQHLAYGELQTQVSAWASGLIKLGLARGERVGVFLEKRIETVVSCFGTSAAGGVFVPINPILRPMQIGHILRDCGVRVLVTSPQRLPALLETLAECPDVRHVVLTDKLDGQAVPAGVALHAYEQILSAAPVQGHRVIDADPVAILYTSGSTGKPKGVVLSHRNMLVGAKSVAQYLGNRADDVLLAALPLSFDAGFSQLTTAFHVGARVVLLNHVLPQDVVKAMAKEGVTGLTAVPPLWIQLCQMKWPESVATHLRYFANTGGRMPLETLTQLRRLFPASAPFLMYGLTEAFRATYLPPDQVDLRPDSIGKAIPNSEVLVLRPDGTPCEADEPGELVQRGPLVALGYWNDPERTAERYKPLPAAAGVRHGAVMVPEMAVFSGDMVRRDAEGYLYFIGRHDEMIKTSGYRVSPTEVEEGLYSTGLVGECVAFGEPDAALGQAIVVVVTPPAGAQDVGVDALLRECRQRLPVYMVPRRIEVRTGSLPRNPNGKIDRKALVAQLTSPT